MDEKSRIIARLIEQFGKLEPTVPTDEAAPVGSYGALGRADCPICHGIGFISYDKPFGDPDFGRIQPCSCRRKSSPADRKLAMARRGNLIGYTEMTFERFNIDGRGQLREGERLALRLAKTAALNFANRLDGWLMFTGLYGTGKTHLAAAIANHCLDAGVDCLFQPVPDLLDWIRSSYSGYGESYGDRFERIRSVPLLVMDDLGAESGTAWADEKIFQILNFRAVNRLATVVTTNCDLRELDGRIASRLSDPALVTTIHLKVPDYRKPFSGADTTFDSLSTLHQLTDRTFMSFEGRRSEPMTDEGRAELDSALRAARAFAADPVGWLIFSGPNGVGKTHIAAAIANELTEKNLREVLFIPVPELLDHLRATFSPTSTISFDRLFESVENAPILILDHLNTTNATTWTKEKLFQIVNYRSLLRLPTVFTTVLPVKDIEPGIQSRMLDSKLTRIVSMFHVPMYGLPCGKDSALPKRIPKRSAR